MDINVFMTICNLFCKVVPAVEHLYAIIVMLTVEHISILVWLKSCQQILLLKEEVPYGLGLGISSPTKPLTLALTHTCNFRCFMGLTGLPQLLLLL